MKTQVYSQDTRIAIAETKIEFMSDQLVELNKNVIHLTDVVQSSTEQMMNVVNNTLHQTQGYYKLAKEDLENHKKQNVEDVTDIKKRLRVLEDKATKASGVMWTLSFLWGSAGLVLGYLLKR